MSAGGEAHVPDCQSGQLSDAHAGQDRQQHERVVAAAEPGAAVGRGEQRLDLFQLEVADGVSLVTLGRDREHSPERVKVFRMSQRGVLAEGVDRRQAVVAGAGAVASGLLEVVEERADQRRVEIVDVEPAGLLAGPLAREREQQPEGVSVGRDGVRT